MCGCLRAVRRGQPDGPAQRLGLVGLLPGEGVQFAAEVAVAGRLAVDRPAQVERLDDAARRQLEVLADQLGDLLVGQAALAVPNVLTQMLIGSG